MQNTKIQDQEGFKSVYFKIADIIMELVVPFQVEITSCLPSFRNFIVKDIQEPPLIKTKLSFSLPPENKKITKLLSDVSIVWGDRFLFEESSEHYIVSVQSENKDRRGTKMYSKKDFKESVIYMEEAELSVTSILSWVLMVAFGQAIIPYKAVLFHASVVVQGDKAYAFLGKSGTGKSTHSRLWIEYLEGVKLLNDDNPIVRIMEDGKIMIFGTPWSGKTPCYRNMRVELQALVRLSQASENKWKNVEGKEALVSVLPSCTAIRWNRFLFNQMVDSLEEIIRKVRVGQLLCLPDKDAAYLCSQKIINNK
ncbi:hypothetical protein GNY06_08125 [Elizabethkingia argentiflava]|uniref:Phosphoenolpyruvate carboxykinase n=1 Tax=Elizabethkingia argenteiflava TaxID=2681556 RepID=A0A845PYB1_9FLAO|nr:hypothetical protein [Elizabethkingia argenteiflava]NAW51348.1 hypothetical protein [Elizabethkingia argenteiflava]